MVEAEFGGLSGHNLDLMALDSNVQCDRLGSPLPHFTPYPTLRSTGVNVFNQDLTNCDGVTVNPYASPPLFYNTFVAFLAVLSKSGANHGSAMLVPFTFLVANGEGDVV